MATKRGLSRFASVMRDADADLPQKTVQPVASGLLAPSAVSPSRMTLDQLLARNVAGQQILEPLSKAAGIADWQYDAGGVDEGGNPLNLGVADAQKLAGLKDYTFDWKDTGAANTGTLTAYDPTGKQFGAYNQQDQSTGSALGEWAALAAAGFGGLGALGLGPLGGVLGGAGAGAAAEGATAGAIGAGEGAAQLAAYTAANPLTAAQVTASMLPAGGLPGLGAVGGGLLASVPAESLASLEAFSAANPVTMAEIAATVPNISMPAAGITSGALESLNAYSAANPVTAETLAATMPQIAPAASAAPAAFNAAADSQLASSQLGITGAQSAAAATAPATVNLGTLGGTMGTAGGLEGLLAGAKQSASELLTTPNAVTGGGGLLGQASSVVNPGLQWLKDNPMLGRLLLGGATSLLSGAGSGGGEAAAPRGPAKQWSSPLQQGLLTPVQQYAPAAIQQRPAGLLAQGYANDGAWRFLGGK